MSTGRPRPVIRHLRRPLWWIAITLMLSGVALVLSLRDRDRLDRGRRDWPRVLASVQSSYVAGEHEIPIRYRHPLTGQAVSLKIVIVRDSLLPRPRSELRVAPDPTNPDVVVVPGDGDELPATALALTIANGVVLAAGTTRWVSVRRVERLARSGEPSFALMGSLQRSRWRTHMVLHLFALDARPGAPAVFACTVLTTAQMPVGDVCFPVEVRGRPVAGGAVVAHAAGGLLWPVRRPTGRGWAARPHAEAAIERPLPVLEHRGRLAPPSICAVIGTGRLLVAVLTLAALAVVPAVIFVNGRAARRVATDGIPVMAEVTERTREGVRVRYGPPGGPRDETASAAGDRVVGRVYPGHVNPDDPDDVWLDADPYSGLLPLGSLGGAAAFTCWLLHGRWRWWRDARRLAADGPWYAVSIDRPDRAGDVDLVPIGESVGLARYRATASEASNGPSHVATTFDPDEAAVSSTGRCLLPSGRRWPPSA